MAKKELIQIRVSEDVKNKARAVLEKQGKTLSSGIRDFLNGLSKKG